jgi:hypothetical protein
MKIFISNSILQFKTRFIPGDCVILPMQKFGGVNKIIINIRWIKPTEIICENDEILREILPYCKDIPVSVMTYSNGIEYSGSPIKNKMNYAIISFYFILFINSVILDNFILSIFLGIIYLTVFFSIILWFSDREKWEAESKRIMYA